MATPKKTAPPAPSLPKTIVLSAEERQRIVKSLRFSLRDSLNSIDWSDSDAAEIEAEEKAHYEPLIEKIQGWKSTRNGKVIL